MSTAVIAAAVARLEAKGMSSEDILDIVKDMLAAGQNAEISSPRRSSSAERQARYRERKASQTVTCDVTRDAAGTVTRDVTNNACDVTSDAPSRIGALAEPELTNLELYPEKQERKNIVGFPKDRKTQPRNQKPSYSPLYELVWQTLPRHPNSSKADGYREFLRLSEEDQNRALDGAMAWQEIIIETRQRQPGYEPPHMSTWLHKRRFDDALDAKPQFRMYGQ